MLYNPSAYAPGSCQFAARSVVLWHRFAFLAGATQRNSSVLSPGRQASLCNVLEWGRLPIQRTQLPVPKPRRGHFTFDCAERVA
jgi:hypothetical protein